MKKAFDNKGYDNKELVSVLNRKNAVRVMLSCAVFSIVIPSMLLCSHLSGFLGPDITSFKVVSLLLEILSIGLALTGYMLLKRDEFEWFKDYGRVGYLVQLVYLSTLCCCGYRYNRNIVFHIVLIAFFIMVPVLDNRDRLFFQIISGMGLFFSIIVFSRSPLAFFEIVVALFVNFIGSAVIHKMAIRNEQLVMRLRNKTISSEKDPLTGVLNRRGLENKAAVMWSYASRIGTDVTAIEIDIDYFKKYNDKFGHPMGDECLRKVALTLENAAKRYTDIIARTGGEEFLVLTQGMEEREVIEFAMTIRNAIIDLAIPHACVNVSKYVTVSMGIAHLSPVGGGTFKDLYDIADRALYQAKENGRNCAVYNGKIYGRMKKSVGTIISM